MSANWIKLSSALALAIAASTPAFAGSKELVDLNTGASSGWRATWATAYDGNVDLISRGTVGGQFFFEKDVTFTAQSAQGIEIVFERISPSASTLVINDEVVRNQTGTAWTGFHFVLASGSIAGTPNFAFATSDGSAGLGDFDITPFTNFAFSDQNTVVSMSGGTVPSGGVWLPGAASNTGLAIVAGNNTDSFTLKEIPVAIPLPAAAWTGLSTLLGLGFFGVAKNARKLLA